MKAAHCTKNLYYWKIVHRLETLKIIIVQKNIPHQSNTELISNIWYYVESKVSTYSNKSYM